MSVNSAAGERECLIALLAALESPERAQSLNPDDPLLLGVARHHRLTPLLSITRGDSLPVRLAEVFRRDRVVTAARNMILGQVAEECIRALAAAGVPTIVLKGLDYETRLYGVVGARPTADVDLLVPNETRRIAFGTLDRLGFEPRAAAPGFDDPDYHEVAWTRDGVEVDLHLALAPFARCRIDYAAVWADAEPFRLGQTETQALGRPHAAVFHALHMAIDHFAVPAIYLVDLARLVPRSKVAAAATVARAWHCERPFRTAASMAAGFALFGPEGDVRLPSPGRAASRVLRAYGPIAPLPRQEQLLRKLLHFDTAIDAARYLAIQTRRNLRELFERKVRKRTARTRLALSLK